MRKSIDISNIGKLTYEENLLTGKVQVLVNDFPAFRINKKLYEYNPGANKEQRVVITLQGNFLTGLEASVNGVPYRLIEKPRWYEWVITILTVAFSLIWGNSPELCAIFPVVGGAIGGGLAGLLAMIGLSFSKQTEKVWLKLLILVGFFALNVLAGYLIALIILGVLL